MCHVDIGVSFRLGGNWAKSPTRALDFLLLTLRLGFIEIIRVRMMQSDLEAQIGPKTMQLYIWKLSRNWGVDTNGTVFFCEKNLCCKRSGFARFMSPFLYIPFRCSTYSCDVSGRHSS